MSLGERIEERMNVLRLSQAELARRAGVPQTTMNGLIRGSSRTTPHLIRIAQVLQTTAAYLMEETDDPEAEFSEVVLSPEELEVVRMFRVVGDSDKQLVRIMLHRLFQLDARVKIEREGQGDEFNEIDYLQCVSEELSEEERAERRKKSTLHAKDK